MRSFLIRRGPWALAAALGLGAAMALAVWSTPARYSATALVEAADTAAAAREAVLLTETGAARESGVALGGANLAAHPVAASPLLALSVTDTDPAQAAQLANTLAEARVTRAEADAAALRAAARARLAADTDAAAAALAAAEAERTAYLDSHLEALASASASVELAALADRRADALAAVDAARTRADAASAALASGDWAGLMAALPGADLAGLESQRQIFRGRLAEAEPGSDIAAGLAAGLERTEAGLRAAAQVAIDGLREQAAGSAGEAGDLAARIRAGLDPAAVPGNAGARLEALTASVAAARGKAEALRSALAAKATDLAAATPALRLLRPAEPPATADARAWLGPVLAALGLGLALGGGLALAAEYGWGRVRRTAHLARLMPGAVTEPLPRAETAPADLPIDAPEAAYAQAMRRLMARSDGVARPGPTAARVIAVVAASPGAGASTAALALARTAAVAGRRALLIDADLAAPAQPGLVGVTPASGLVDYLAASANDDEAADGDAAADCFDDDPRSALGVVFGRPGAPVPEGGPLQTEAFRRLVAEARESFDTIVIDGPPLSAGDGALFAAGLADATLLVARAGSARAARLGRAGRTLARYLAPGGGLIGVLTAARRG